MSLESFHANSDDVGEGRNEDCSIAALCGPLCLGLSVGIQWMLLALIVWGPLSVVPAKAMELTALGARLFEPERDLIIYVIGCVLTMIGTAALVSLWRFNVRGQPASQRSRFAAASSTLQITLGAVSFVGFVALWPALRRFGTGGQVILFPSNLMLLLTPGVLALITGTLGLLIVRKFAGARFGEKTVQVWERLTRRTDQGSGKQGYGRMEVVMDVIIPLAICAIIYVPVWRELSGALFLHDEFHHWDFFAMGPALGFSHGRALGTEVYAQYGVGWPMLLCLITRIVPLSYEFTIYLAILYGCVYFVGIYLLLRLLVKNAAWALVGVAAALTLQMFRGIEPGAVLWQYPSSTVIRAPFDVWFFVAVLMYLRSQRMLWAMTTGLTVGLALLFETETGLYLSVTCACFFLVSARYFAAKDVRTHFKCACVSGLTAVITSCLGLTIASRGTLLHAQFWTGWGEAIFKYEAGISMLPIAGVPNTTVMLFAVFLVVYLFGLTRMLIVSLAGRAGESDLFLGSLSLYGLGTLILFVGRSHPYNIYHVSIPFAVITVVILAGISHRLLAGSGRRQLAVQHAFPLLCAFGACVALFSQAAFQRYPNLFWLLRHGYPDKGLSLSHAGIHGLPLRIMRFADQFDVVTAKMRELKDSGKSIAIFDHADTKYYLVSGVAPWSRYSPLVPFLLAKTQVESLKRELLERRPDYVFISNDLRRMQAYDELDTRQALQNTLKQHYELEGTAGMFEVWHPIK